MTFYGIKIEEKCMEYVLFSKEISYGCSSYYIFSIHRTRYAPGTTWFMVKSSHIIVSNSIDALIFPSLMEWQTFICVCYYRKMQHTGKTDSLMFLHFGYIQIAVLLMFLPLIYWMLSISFTRFTLLYILNLSFNCGVQCKM